MTLLLHGAAGFLICDQPPLWVSSGTRNLGELSLLDVVPSETPEARALSGVELEGVFGSAGARGQYRLERPVPPCLGFGSSLRRILMYPPRWCSAQLASISTGISVRAH